MMGVDVNAATWRIAGLATFGVIARPWTFRSSYGRGPARYCWC
jgi:hypothetical protein